MTRYIAFLRGINVGGHIATKETLRKAFQTIGYQNVSTYKQSGNLVFETSNENAAEAKAEIECCLKAVLGYEVRSFLRTMPQLKAIIESDALRSQSREGTSFLVTFLETLPVSFSLSLPYTIPKSTAKIIEVKGTEVFSVTHGGGEGALPNPFLEKTLKTKSTTRNLNVIRGMTEKFG